MEYVAVLRDREILQLEKDVRTARIGCQKLKTKNREMSVRNNITLDENKHLREERQRLTDLLNQPRKKSEPEEGEVQELERVDQNVEPEVNPDPRNSVVGNLTEPEIEANTEEKREEASRMFTYSFEYNGSHW